MRNTERVRNGFRDFCKGPRDERPSTVIFGQGISCIFIYEYICVCISSLLFMYALRNCKCVFNEEFFNAEGSTRVFIC